MRIKKSFYRINSIEFIPFFVNGVHLSCCAEDGVDGEGGVFISECSSLFPSSLILGFFSGIEGLSERLLELLELPLSLPLPLLLSLDSFLLL